MRLGDKNIAECGNMPLRGVRAFLGGLVAGVAGVAGDADAAARADEGFTEPLAARERAIADPLLRAVIARLGFLIDVGLDYLTLDRSAQTLSGGEGQRIRLATQIGAALVGVLYVLDEPSVGLHARDNARLLEALRRLVDLGNSVIVVEHDRDAILAADHIVDMGPGAGIHGGHVVAQGTPAEIARNPASITGPYLSGDKTLSLPSRRRKPDGRVIRLVNARVHNLQTVTAEIPIGLFTAITGVSGSGKSSLIVDTLLPAVRSSLYRANTPVGDCDGIEGLSHIDKVISIDQAPIGRTPRSNPATYTGVFALLRDLYASLPEARARGYKPGRFSFNVKGGRCEACQGDGVLRIEMHFLPDIFVTCETCSGRRYNRETLEVLYRGMSIADALDLTVDQGLEQFETIPRVRERLAGAVATGGARVHHAGAAGDDAERRRGAAGEAGAGAGAEGDRAHALRARRADDGAPLLGHRGADGGAHQPAGRGQYRGGDRAQPRRDRLLRLGDRSRARRGRARGQGGGRGDAGAGGRGGGELHREVFEGDAEREEGGRGGGRGPEGEGEGRSSQRGRSP